MRKTVDSVYLPKYEKYYLTIFMHTKIQCKNKHLFVLSIYWRLRVCLPKC